MSHNTRMRTPIVAGNWKMNKHIGDARRLAGGIAEGVAEFDGIDIVVGPTPISLAAVGEVVDQTNVGLAAQTMHWADGGAFTGEVSPTMIADAGASWVILGHSERRQYFGESDQAVNHKAQVAVDHGLRAIICIGESLAERQDGRTAQKVEFQVRAALAGIDADALADIVVAYEPLWAIGTGESATPDQAQAVHADIRTVVADLYDQSAADGLRILYGGSVKPHNIETLIGQPDIDGALIGGASLQVESFVEIADIVQQQS